MKKILLKLFSLMILAGIFITPVTNSNYLDTETSSANIFTAGCWTAPTIPSLVSPINNAYTNVTNIILDWSDSGFYCPGQTVEYQYKWNSEESAWQSASTISFSVSEGTHVWQVRAKDSQGYVSDYSPAWTVTVDRTPPITTLSFSGKNINEKVLNGGFESGTANWQTQGQITIQGADAFTAPYNGTKMAKIGHTVDDGNEIWENKLTQQIQPGAKNLSFYYNFFSYDPLNDDPGMVVRLNDYNVFYLSAADIENFDSPNSSGWTQLSFDISQIPDPVLEIIFYSGNTEDEFSQSWVYIDDISTAEAVANDGADFSFTVNEPAQTLYSLDGGPFIDGTAFDLATITGSTLVRYYSIDLAGNIEGINTKRLVKDTQSPDTILDLFAFATSKQTIDLSWTSPSDPPNASSSAVYDIRYSSSQITESNFLSAAQISNPPAPRRAGEFQSFTVSGLDFNTLYYFAIKSADAALNWSLTSNSPSDTTLDPTDPLSDPDINHGDVVINELMWMGTSGSSSDEFLELRNMTDQDIDLTGWVIANAGFGNTDLLIPDGSIILAHGYFLITNFNPTALQSKLNDSLVPDWITTSLTLYNSNAQYLLQDSFGVTIDTADNGLGLPAAGQLDSGNDIYYSMERDSAPGDGSQASSWHTIFDDSALMHSYWDLNAVEKGTPGGENLSQAQSRPVETEVKLSYSHHSVSFIISNVDRFNQLKYALTYDSDSGPQGIIGTMQINQQPIIEVKDLITGTCSTGGTCVYHQGIKQINLEVVLSGAIEKTLTESLSL